MYFSAKYGAKEEYRMLRLTYLFILQHFSVFLGLLAIATLVQGQQTLYDYFTEGGINSGLVADNRDTFSLNGKDLKLFSGSLHYFRVHPDQWRDRLRKYRYLGSYSTYFVNYDILFTNNKWVFQSCRPECH